MQSGDQGMERIPLVIAQRGWTAGRRGQAKRPKGTVFKADVLAYITAPGWWDGEASKLVRPVWMMLAGTSSELRYFKANLVNGKAAVRVLGHDQTEEWSLLKSVPMGWLEQCISLDSSWAPDRSVEALPVDEASALDEASVLTVYHRELFQSNPGFLEPGGICTFLCLTPAWWADEQQDVLGQRELLARLQEHADRMGWLTGAGLSPLPRQLNLDALIAMLPQAALVISYLQQRIVRPLLADPVFYLQLLLHGLRDGLFRFPATSESLSCDRHGYDSRSVQQSADLWLWARRAADHRSIHTWGLEQIGASVCGMHASLELLNSFLAREIGLYRSPSLASAVLDLDPHQHSLKEYV